MPDLCDLCDMYDLYGLDHVAGQEPFNLYALVLLTVS